MGNIRIPFRGITRNTDDGLCEDGDSMELINAKIENGSLEPVGKPMLKKALTHEYTAIYHHSVTNHYIGITADGSLYSMPEDMGRETYMELSGVKSVQIIGNTIAAATGGGLVYYIYKQGAYYYLGGLPELPDFQIEKNLGIEWAYTDKANPTSFGSYMKLVSEANRKGYYAHAAAFRVAFRLYDGSYIKHSHIRVLYLHQGDVMESGRDPDKNTFKGRNALFPFDSETHDSGGRVTHDNNEFQESKAKNIPDEMHQSGLLVFTPRFVFDTDSLGLLSSWSDIILSIDIFSTDSFRHPYPHIINGDFKNPERDTAESPVERIKNMSRFYKIASISIGEDAKGIAHTLGMDVSADNLAVQQELPDDMNTHNESEYEHLSSYNNMLHVWGRKEHYFPWYKDSGVFFDNIRNGIGKRCDLYVTIQTRERTMTLEKLNVSCPETWGPYLMYPDVNARSITIVCPSLNKHKTFTLTPHGSLNLAYHLSYEDSVTERDPGHTPVRHEGGLATEVMSEWEDGSLPFITTDDVGRTDYNILRVSKVNNPFIFPPKQTYQFNTSIVGIQSNTVAMSQGQFGSFPLYVFTEDGIHSLSVGNGEVTYVSQVPVSRDVCNNPDSICALDSAVVFSSERGLMMIEGAQTTLLSENIDGFLPSCMMSSPVIPKILNIASMGGAVSSVVFRDYLKGAKVGYNYQDKSVIVSNKAYPYSYVFNIKTGMWHKLSQSYDGFVNAYPYTWALANEGNSQIYDLNNNHRSVAVIAYVSRPIKCGTLTYKRILQSALRGIVKGALSDLYLKGEPVKFRGEDVQLFHNVGFYVLGSNDAEHFSLVAKKEFPQDVRDLVTKMNKSKAHKYFMICLVGGVRTDVSLNYVEMMVDESFTNRLR